MTENISVSIDGPTASGKSTLASTLAAAIGTTFLDTGLTFRALAYALHREPIVPDENWRSLVEHRPSAYPRRDSGPASPLPHPHPPHPRPAVRYRGRDILDDIWHPELDQHLTAVATDPRWRAQILHFHQEVVAAHRRIIAVGRDVATTLLPDAVLHVCLTANLAVRRERRRAQHRHLWSRSVTVGPATHRDEEVRATVQGRPNGIVLDTTYLPAAAVSASVRRRLGQLPERATEP